MWRIRDVYPGSWFLPIPDPGSKNSNKRERWKKICCHIFSCSHKFHKIVNYFSFEVLKKKIWANFQGILELFTKKIVKKLLKIWSWDPGSEIPDPEKTYSGSRIQGSKRHRIPDPQHCTPHRFSEFSSVPPVTCSSVPFSHPCLTSYVPCLHPMPRVLGLCSLPPFRCPQSYGSLSLDLCPKSLFLVSRPLYHISRNCPVSHLSLSVP